MLARVLLLSVLFGPLAQGPLDPEGSSARARAPGEGDTGTEVGPPLYLQTALDEIAALRGDGRHDQARRRLEELFEGDAYQRLLGEEHQAVMAGLEAIDGAAGSLDLLQIQAGVRAELVELLSGRSDADAPALLDAKLRWGDALRRRGDVQAAHALGEAVHAARERLLPADHPDLLTAKQYLGGARYELGDLEGAHALFEEVHAARERLFPADHPDLLTAKQNLATMRSVLGDLEGAHALGEAVYVARERRLPADHPDLLGSKQYLAGARYELGDLEGAHALFEEVHAARERLLPADHPDLLRAKGNLAVTRYELGDLEGAHTVFEEVHAASERLLPADHPSLLLAKQNLAATHRGLGNLAAALALDEAVNAARERLLPADHPDLLAAKQNLAVTRSELGDLESAHALFEEVHSALEQMLPADHPDLLLAKQNVAVMRNALGDHENALALEEAVHAARERRLPSHHPDLLAAKQNLAATLKDLGDLAGALALDEVVHSVREQLLPAHHPQLLRSKGNLGVTRKALGDLESALVLEETVHAAWERLLPADHPDLLQAKQNLATTRYELGDLAGALDVTRSLLSGQLAVASALRTAAPRVARSAARRELHRLSAGEFWTSLARPGGKGADLDALFFAVLENLRLVSTSSSEAALAVKRFPELGELHERASRARRELNDLGVSAPEGEDTERLDEWRKNLLDLSEERDRLERELRRELARKGVSSEALQVDAVAKGLDGDAALVSFFRYRAYAGGPSSGRREEEPVDSLLAFVVVPDGTVERVPLGAAAKLEGLARDWRRALGKPIERGVRLAEQPASREQEVDVGGALREALLDPCLAVLGSEPPAALHLILDDFLHLLPVDALPWKDGRRLGETFDVRIETSARRLLSTPRSPKSGELLAIGGVDFDAEDVDAPRATLPLATPPVEASKGRKGMPGSFEPLVQSRYEVEALGDLYEDLLGGEGMVLTRGDATKAALHERAPTARYLHIATHGWFAPETFKSFIDSVEEQAERDILERADETLHGFAPETLCGLALAGANQGANRLGKVPGIITAEELATLDLSNCELAVLSACETNVGLRRAGQGILSLQAALRAAGARTAVTSLWRVDDAATRRLMELFYTKLWKEGLGKADALWAAKMALRGEGHPVRDWAGWVLTGDPD